MILTGRVCSPCRMIPLCRRRDRSSPRSILQVVIYRGPLSVKHGKLGYSTVCRSRRWVWAPGRSSTCVGASSRRSERQKVVQSALESGIGLCDSSPMYNEAERALDDALRKHGHARALVATKVCISSTGGPSARSRMPQASSMDGSNSTRSTTSPLREGLICSSH
jgi:aryl-alcohol dehydrogenase-like predicted oxidoreductase